MRRTNNRTTKHVDACLETSRDGGSNPPASIRLASPKRGIRTLKGSGKRIFPGRRCDRQRSCRQRGRAPMEICSANLGSRPKAGIPPPPFILKKQAPINTGACFFSANTTSFIVRARFCRVLRYIIASRRKIVFAQRILRYCAKISSSVTSNQYPVNRK